MAKTISVKRVKNGRISASRNARWIDPKNRTIDNQRGGGRL